MRGNFVLCVHYTIYEFFGKFMREKPVLCVNKWIYARLEHFMRDYSVLSIYLNVNPRFARNSFIYVRLGSARKSAICTDHAVFFWLEPRLR